MKTIITTLIAAGLALAADAPKPTPELERAQLTLQVAQAKADVARANYAAAEARIAAAKSDQSRINAEWPALEKAVREAAEAVAAMTKAEKPKAEAAKK